MLQGVSEITKSLKNFNIFEEMILRKICFGSRLIVIALLGSAAPVVHSQSSATVYGLIDLGTTYINNVGGRRTIKEDSGAAFTSRFGFRGSEDLGDGLSAIFTLESGIDPDTGTVKAPSFFNRESFVGLKSESLGKITFGRQFDFMFISMVPDSAPFIQGGLPAGYNGFASKTPGPPPAVDVHLGGVSYDNSVKWEKSIGPWSGGLMYGLGTENSRDRMYSAFLKYADPTFQLGVGWVKDNFSTAVFANEAFAIKGLYRIGDFKVMAGAAQGKETVFAGSHAKVRPVELALDYSASPFLNFGGGFGYSRATARNGLSATLTQPFVGTRYALSKRTTLYAMAARNHTSDPNVVPSTVGVPGGATSPSSGASQTVVRMGMGQHTSTM